MQPQGFRVHGDVVLPPDFQFAPAGPRIQRKSLGPTQPGTLGKQRLAVILANFGNGIEPVTPAQVERWFFNQMDGVSADFFKASYEQMRLEGMVTNWYHVARPAQTACAKDYDPNTPDDHDNYEVERQLTQAALTRADPDLNYNEYDYVFVLNLGVELPCAGGLAFVSSSSFQTDEKLRGVVAWQVVGPSNTGGNFIHELVHLLGVYGHAYQADCFPDVVPKNLWEACQGLRRNEDFSVTGSNIYLEKPWLNAIELERLGWLVSGEGLLSVGHQGVVRKTIESLDRLSRQLKVLRVRRGILYPPNGKPIDVWYYLSYVPSRGVLVHTNFFPPPDQSEDTFLLDVTPSKGFVSNNQVDQNVALAAGKTFRDPSGVTIQTVWTNADEAELEISIPRDTVAPLVRFAGLQEVMVATSGNPSDPVGQPKIVPLAVEAADNQQITKVSFYADDTFVGSDDVPPFTWKWDVTNLADRSSHRVKAVASDAANNTATVEDLVTIRVDQTRPIIRIVSPKWDQTLTGPDPVTIEVDARDGETGLSYVAVTRFKLNPDGSSTEEANQFLLKPPYVSTWKLAQVSPGKYEIHVWAADHAGNWNYSYTRVEVRALDTTAPVVSIISPSQGTVRGAVPVRVAAYDPESGIGQVTISVTLSGPIQVKSTSAVVLASFTQPPYQTEWTPREDGTYTLTVKAVNGAGLSTTETVELQVANRAQDLTIQRQGTNLVISWNGEWVLESANAITGPWEPALYAKSPYTVAVTQAAQFYRLGPPSATTVEPAAPAVRKQTVTEPLRPPLISTPTLNPPAMRPTAPVSQAPRSAPSNVRVTPPPAAPAVGSAAQRAGPSRPAAGGGVIRSRRSLSRR